MAAKAQENSVVMFTHLHVHSHYSILDGMSKVSDLIKKCKKNGMYAMALTDHGNMFGIKDLIDTSNKENGKVKDAIKAQQLILDNDGSTAEEKQEATYQIEQLKAQIFKPIIGIEAYCARRTLYDKDKDFKELDPETGRERVVDASGYHLILLAKNKEGYKNLCKLSSIAYTDGYYHKPRIDRNVLEQYHEGLIVCSACLGGELPQKIMHGDMALVEEAVQWYKRVFGDDYYIELQRHKTDKPGGATDVYERQERVNPILIDLARKYGIKIVATNDVHFVEEEHGEAHDHLICISTQVKVADEKRLHYTKQEWLKTPQEMESIFADLPEALANTQEIVDKVSVYSIDSDPIMPMFPIPESFGSEEEYRNRITEQELFDEFTRNEKGEVVLTQEKAEAKIKKLGGYDKLYRIKFEADYLNKLVWDGAHRRYGEELTEEQKDRIVFELHTIKTMGFPGYFLIVQDYIRGAREELGVSVGPGRGSAAGSVVAYCLWITDVDPLKYDLLFERFLNPDRISLPDIDVDFDDAGRGRVLDWVTQKYGKEKVAHIITYGTMATKSSIADVGRVEDIPLETVSRLKSYVPEKSFDEKIKDENGKSPKVTLKNCYKYLPEFQSIFASSSQSDVEIQSLLTYAEELEGTNRQIGIHACGVIIGADDLTKFAPVCTVKDKVSGEDVVVTQYDGHVIETVGLIKMDFLGLKTLTIIKDALREIKKTKGIDIDINQIPIDDQLTYDLYCAGNTVGTFQFESEGMQKYLRELEPHVFEDLIAMNALYRPGPMDYIPDFIDRKQGRKPITYDIPCMEKYLKDTYGITVYQEQVMLLSRQLAGFTRGQSDTLRKAMGKKQIEKMNELEVLFYEGGEKNGHPKEILKKIWEDWKKFASYAFNKSHATCYSWVSYQTDYLKAHYPAEYMSAVLTSGQSDITNTTKYIEDCHRMGVDVLLPSVNESDLNFSVNQNGQIRFGLQAISGMGESVSTAIINERKKNGPFVDVFDFLERMDMRTINRKNLESLVKAGAFDGVGEMHRAQYMYCDGIDNSSVYIEKLARWAAKEQESKNSAQMSLFELSDDFKGVAHPPIPECEPWSAIERCNHEKEVIGFYISGHPLDEFKYEMKTFVCHSSAIKDNLEAYVGRDITLGGVVASSKSGVFANNGKPYCNFVLEDYDGTIEIKMSYDTAVKFSPFCQKGSFVFVRATVKQWDKMLPDGSLSKGVARLNIVEITSLGSIIDRYAQLLRCKVLLSAVDAELCNRLKALGKQNPGKVPLQLQVFDEVHNLTLTMSNNNFKINVRNAIPLLEQIPGVVGITPVKR
ncbi:MAG: DNA polymerase III subunit alpha [Bacteroidales bacterium]|nr:DNA polymerase III subunit alpha [Candidatus Colimorpha onthohippi]